VQRDAYSFTPNGPKPRRLHPRHALRRAIVLRAYRKDGNLAVNQVDALPWTEHEKQLRRHDIECETMKRLVEMNQLEGNDVCRVFEQMRKTRTDLVQVEQEARVISWIYSIVSPLTTLES